jgi:hypothetical protein
MNLKNFFRKDLNLMSRWWHRLFFVIFIIAFIWAIWLVISNMLDNNQLPKYKKVGMLSDRMTSNVQLIGNLVKPNEKIAVYEHNLYGSYLGKNFYDGNGGWLLKQEYYCAKDISSHTEEISKITGVNNYKGNSKLVSLSEFKSYLVKQGADCIENLKLDPINFLGNIRNTLTWGLEADEMAVWQVSVLKTIFAILLPILFTATSFVLLFVIYYKVFLFIVFGKYQKTK